MDGCDIGMNRDMIWFNGRGGSTKASFVMRSAPIYRTHLLGNQQNGLVSLCVSKVAFCSIEYAFEVQYGMHRDFTELHL